MLQENDQNERSPSEILFKTEDICRVLCEEGQAKLEGMTTAHLLRACQLWRRE